MLAVIVNSMPNFSKRRRVVQPNRLNPLRPRAPRGIPLSDPAAERILNQWAERNGNRQRG